MWDTARPHLQREKKVSRRRFLVSGTAIGVSLGAPMSLAACSENVTVAGGGDRLSRTIRAALDDVAGLALEAEPEAATRLGLMGRGAPPGLAAELSPRSQAGFERSRLDRIEILKHLSNMPIAGRGTRLRTQQIAIMGAYDRAVAMQAFGFGRVALSTVRPYVLDHLSGAYLDVPLLLLSRQPVSSVEDADAYLARLTALPDAIRDERRRLRADAIAGIVPPRPVLAAVSARAEALAAVDPGTHPLVLDLANRTEALGALSNEARQSRLVATTRLLAGPMRQAYLDLAEETRQLSELASDLPGLSAFQIGQSYYETMLRTGLGPNVRIDDLFADLDVRMRTAVREYGEALDAVGLPPGPLRDRRFALDTAHADAALTSPVLTDALADHMETLRPRLRQVVARLPDADAVIAMSPANLWAPYEVGDFTYEPAAADGGLSGTLRLSAGTLKAAQTAGGLASLRPVLEREGLPGRHLVRAIAIEDTAQPLLRHLTFPDVFETAWGVYGLDLATELGRTDDPAATAFRRQAELDLIGAAKVDLGIHALGWPSVRALSVLQAEAGMPEAAATATLWRLAVRPSEAIGAIYGRSVFRALRRRASNALGGDFDPAAFHYTLLTTGPRPFQQVDAEMRAWASAQLS